MPLQYRINHQYNCMKMVKEKMESDECVFQVDFSENNNSKNCKAAEELCILVPVSNRYLYTLAMPLWRSLQVNYPPSACALWAVILDTHQFQFRHIWILFYKNSGHLASTGYISCRMAPPPSIEIKQISFCFQLIPLKNIILSYSLGIFCIHKWLLKCAEYIITLVIGSVSSRHHLHSPGSIPTTAATRRILVNTHKAFTFDQVPIYIPGWREAHKELQQIAKVHNLNDHQLDQDRTHILFLNLSILPTKTTKIGDINKALVWLEEVGWEEHLSCLYMYN